MFYHYLPNVAAHSQATNSCLSLLLEREMAAREEREERRVEGGGLEEAAVEEASVENAAVAPAEEVRDEGGYTAKEREEGFC